MKAVSGCRELEQEAIYCRSVMKAEKLAHITVFHCG
jgi:hypothetical protein